MNKNITITLVVIMVIAIGAYFFPTSKTVVERVSEKVVGAVSTLDGVDSSFTSIGGVEVNYVSVGITATSSTICSIPVPENATSTLLMWKVAITDGILGANNMSLSTGTNSYATSSNFLILDRAVGSNLGDHFSWLPNASTTVATDRMVRPLVSGESPYFLRPGESLNLRLSTTTGAGALGDYYDGTCSAVFLKQ